MSIVLDCFERLVGAVEVLEGGVGIAAELGVVRDLEVVADDQPLLAGLLDVVLVVPDLLSFSPVVRLRELHQGTLEPVPKINK